jgi:type I restriction enzyme S subunit
MNPEFLLAHFDRISAAPDAIPKLRGFILDLAVRGKLVEQNPMDEPAAELMNRIVAKKSKSGKSAGVARLDATAENVPFTIPSNWVWVRLGDICSKTGSGSTPRGGKSVYQPDGVPFLRSQNVHNDGLRLDDVAYITPQTHEKMSATAIDPGDLLLNITGGSIGRCCSVPASFGQANISQHVAIIRAAIDGIQQYIHQLVLSPYFQSFVLSEQTGAGRGGLPKNRMDRIPVALPPLAEQQRIVSRAQELMLLCDQLEAARAEKEGLRDRLTIASHHLLSNGANVDATRKHADFFFSHLPRLTACQNHVQQLRQIIRTLGIQGRLVRQDPTDESASQLVKEIAENRERLYAAKKIPKPTQLPLMTERDTPFNTPNGWCWTMLGDLCYQVSDGPHFSPQYVGPQEGVPFLSTRNVRPGAFDLSSLKYISHKDHEVFSKRIRPEKGDILYTKGGTTGLAKVNDLDFQFSVWVHLAVLRIDKERLLPRYVELALNSPHCYAQSQRYTQGISNFDLGLTRMVKITIPLPPLAEQHRIVAKVNELMTVCDGLEEQLTTAQEESGRLLASVLHHALHSSDRVPELKGLLAEA